jgi:hypothetical protein
MYYFQFLLYSINSDICGIRSSVIIFPLCHSLKACTSHCHSWYAFLLISLVSCKKFYCKEWKLLVLNFFRPFRYDLRSRQWMNPWSLLDANCQMKRSHPKAHPVIMAIVKALCLHMHTGVNERLLHTGIHQAQHPLCSARCHPTGTHLLQSAVQPAVRPLAPQALHPRKTTDLTFCHCLPVLAASWRLNETC